MEFMTKILLKCWIKSFNHAQKIKTEQYSLIKTVIGKY